MEKVGRSKIVKMLAREEDGTQCRATQNYVTFIRFSTHDIARGVHININIYIYIYNVYIYMYMYIIHVCITLVGERSLIKPNTWAYRFVTLY